MNQTVDRRGFLKTTGALTAAVGLGKLGGPGLSAAEAAAAASAAQELGWRLACQAYSFNGFTFYETIDKVASLGLHYIEGYASQRISADMPETRTNAAMPAQVRKQVKQRLADAGIRLASYCSVALCGSGEDEYRKEFDFAKEMGVEMLVSEPPRRALETIDALCHEYQIRLAVHNHDFPCAYWDAATALKACHGRSTYIGVCGNAGYWMRVGVRPVQMIEKLGQRMISLYLNDVNQFGRVGAHDVPWGTGKADVRGILQTVHRLGIRPQFVIEYGYHWRNSLPEIAQCVRYFEGVAKELFTG